MPWVRFADDYLSNTKVVLLGPLARLLDVSAIIYSARELRDGQLSQLDVQMVATLARIPKWGLAAAELVQAGRWSQTAEGFEIHDYLTYQPSREQVLRKRAADAERMRKARTPGEVRANVAPDSAPDSGPESRRSSRVPDPDPDPVNPVPDPEPPRTPPDEQGGRLPRRGRRRRSEAELLEPTLTRPEDAMQLGCAEHADHWTASCDTCVSRRDASIEASRDVLEAVMNGAAR